LNTEHGSPTALIAEDEPLLAANLKANLGRLWPSLRIAATVSHGVAAVEQALKARPDVLFLDIRMPGMTGLDVVEALAEDWPHGAAFPLVVFVTAYDQYAVRAFERAAVDYLLKPVDVERLGVTCARLQAALKARDRSQAIAPDQIVATLSVLRSALDTGPAAPKLAVLQASLGATIHMVPIGAVVYFEAADKYIRVITAAREYLIRMPLRQLLQQLDPRQFWQIHRAVVVRVEAIATATRDETGKVELTLRGHPAKLVASRLYAHLFKAM
jgi:DNA-binding LytR/AlgR family response regulator